jgi:hypothetical protein
MSCHPETTQDRFDAWLGEVPSASMGEAIAADPPATSPESSRRGGNVYPAVADENLAYVMDDEDLYRRHEPVISWILSCPMLGGNLRMVPDMSPGSPVDKLLGRSLERVPCTVAGVRGAGRFELALVMLLRRLGWIAIFDPRTGKVRQVIRPSWLGIDAPRS